MYLSPGEKKELGSTNTNSFSWIFGSPTLKKEHMGQTTILRKPPLNNSTLIILQTTITNLYVDFCLFLYSFLQIDKTSEIMF